jgi:hypothetical protein
VSVWYKLGKIERLSIRTCTGTCSRTLHVSVHVQQLKLLLGFWHYKLYDSLAGFYITGLCFIGILKISSP